ncbi:inositol polyphosphate-5-phosphatase A [Hylobates moloch]|nr:inositol polyphosphate-5-phosphatase A [Hylobates moloch]
MAGKAAAPGTAVLLVTANVGSLFDDPENLQKNWLREFYQVVHTHKPHFMALHCQEFGGKNYEASMSHVDKFVKELLSSDAMKEYNRARVYLDENYKSQEHFTALGSFYFLHESLKNIYQFDFKAKKYRKVTGKEIYSDTLESTPMLEKEKFPQDYFPEAAPRRIAPRSCLHESRAGRGCYGADFQQGHNFINLLYGPHLEVMEPWSPATSLVLEKGTCTASRVSLELALTGLSLGTVLSTAHCGEAAQVHVPYQLRGRQRQAQEGGQVPALEEDACPVKTQRHRLVLALLTLPLASENSSRALAGRRDVSVLLLCANVEASVDIAVTHVCVVYAFTHVSACDQHVQNHVNRVCQTSPRAPAAVLGHGTRCRLSGEVVLETRGRAPHALAVEQLLGRRGSPSSQCLRRALDGAGRVRGQWWPWLVPHGHLALQPEGGGVSSGGGATQNKTTPLFLSRIIDQRFEKVSYFVFGDFNFRLDSKSVVETLCTKATMQTVRAADTNEVVKLIFRESDNDRKVMLQLEKKLFDYFNQEVFRDNNGTALLEFDKELSVFKDRLYELDISFPPSYPYSEDARQGEQYMNTRCPAWCDRILMSPSAKELVLRSESEEKVVTYDHIGPNVCMGDHKPVFLAFRIMPGAGKPHAHVHKCCVVQ